MSPSDTIGVDVSHVKHLLNRGRTRVHLEEVSSPRGLHSVLFTDRAPNHEVQRK